METLSLAEARLLALAAQGFVTQRPPNTGLRGLRQTIARLQLLQIDAVNVLVRAQYLPLFARLGAYSRDLLDNLVYGQRELFEYAGHAASLLPIELEPNLRWRKRMFEMDPRWAVFRPAADAVLREIEQRGPLSVSGLTTRGERIGSFWTSTRERYALEWLYLSGKLAVAGRVNGQAVFDLTERVIPRSVLDVPTPSLDDARRELLRRAAGALGVATADDLVEYFHMNQASTRLAQSTDDGRARRALDLVKDLVSDGSLVSVEVEAWEQQAYMVPGTRFKKVAPRALVSPFDSLLFNRKRVTRLFSFAHSFEMYVPEAKRQFGYYVLSFLLGDRLVARVDLKADRNSHTLRVQSAFAEPECEARLVAEELAAELASMARWLGLERVEVAGKGDLSPALASALESASLRL